MIYYEEIECKNLSYASCIDKHYKLTQCAYISSVFKCENSQDEHVWAKKKLKLPHRFDCLRWCTKRNEYVFS